METPLTPPPPPRPRGAMHAWRCPVGAVYRGPQSRRKAPRGARTGGWRLARRAAEGSTYHSSGGPHPAHLAPQAAQVQPDLLQAADCVPPIVQLPEALQLLGHRRVGMAGRDGPQRGVELRSGHCDVLGGVVLQLQGRGRRHALTPGRPSRPHSHAPLQPHTLRVCVSTAPGTGGGPRRHQTPNAPTCTGQQSAVHQCSHFSLRTCPPPFPNPRAVWHASWSIWGLQRTWPPCAISLGPPVCSVATPHEQGCIRREGWSVLRHPGLLAKVRAYLDSLDDPPRAAIQALSLSPDGCLALQVWTGHGDRSAPGRGRGECSHMRHGFGDGFASHIESWTHLL